MGRSVLILPGALDMAIRKMFNDQGFVTVSNKEDADFLCFSGGSDVSPQFYGDHTHNTTSSHPERDKREEEYFLWAIDHGLPMVGICRGAQFLHVMNGGKLYQNVDNHAIKGKHKAYVYNRPSEPVEVTSTHHQMMKWPDKDIGMEVLLTARESTVLQSMSHLEAPRVEYKTYPKLTHTKPIDLEAVYYESTTSLCFQPHPELDREGSTEELFFEFLDDFILDKL